MFASSFFAAAASLVLAAPVLALPAGINPPPQFFGCSLANANAKIPLPANPAPLTVPTGAPSFVALGFGIQNYTCSSTGTYTATGAVAQLIDFSCATNTPNFANASAQLSTAAFDAWNRVPESVTIQQIIAGQGQGPRFAAPIVSAAVLGQHYFVPNPTGAAGVSPKWDFTSSGATKGNANAFVVGAKDAGLKATDAADVDLLQLHGVQGSLATSIYRLATKGGQPPASCTVGTADISVKYVSQYWFYGSTVA